MTPRIATFLMFVVNGMVVGTWVALIPGIQERLSMPADQLGIILFFAAFGALFGQQITGQLLVRVSSRVLLTAGGLLLPLMVVAPTLAPSPASLAVVLFFFGMLNTTMDVAMNAHGVALETSGGTSILSRLHSGWSVGGILGSVGVAVALLLGAEPTVEAFVAAALMLVVAASASRFLGQGSVRTEGAARGIHLPGRAVLPVGLLMVLVAFVEGGLTDWGGVYLRQGVQSSAGVAALAFAAFSLGLFIGRIGGDWAKDRIGSVRLLQAGMLLTAVAVAAFLIVGSDVVALVGMVVAGIGMANAVPQLLGAAARIRPYGPSLSAVFTLLTVAFMAGPPLIGATTEAFGISTAFTLFILASLAVVILVPRVPAAETSVQIQR